MQPPNNDDTAFQDESHGDMVKCKSGRKKVLDLMEMRRKLRLSISAQTAMLQQVEEALDLPPDKRYR